MPVNTGAEVRRNAQFCSHPVTADLPGQHLAASLDRPVPSPILRQNKPIGRTLFKVFGYHGKETARDQLVLRLDNIELEVQAYQIALMAVSLEAQ